MDPTDRIPGPYQLPGRPIPDKLYPSSAAMGNRAGVIEKAVPGELLQVIDTGAAWQCLSITGGNHFRAILRSEALLFQHQVARIERMAAPANAGKERIVDKKFGFCLRAGCAILMKMPVMEIILPISIPVAMDSAKDGYLPTASIRSKSFAILAIV